MGDFLYENYREFFLALKLLKATSFLHPALDNQSF